MYSRSDHSLSFQHYYRPYASFQMLSQLFTYPNTLTPTGKWIYHFGNILLFVIFLHNQYRNSDEEDSIHFLRRIYIPTSFIERRCVFGCTHCPIEIPLKQTITTIPYSLQTNKNHQYYTREELQKIKPMHWIIPIWLGYKRYSMKSLKIR